MSDVASAPATLPVALVYGDADACAHLRTALAEFNADIVYDSAGSDLDRSALGSSGARVAVVNLDDALDPSLDEVYAVLEAAGCRVVFNDPGSSVTLEGWEHARWVRHLASKLRDDVDVDPPRPANAEPVDVAEAAHLGDQWLDDALGVLAADDGVPPVADAEPEPSAGVDVGAVEMPADALDDAVAPSMTLEPTAVEPPTASVADVPSETAAAADATGADSAAQIEPESLDPDFAVSAEPSTHDVPATDTADAAADDLGMAELEQQLNDSFAADSDAAAAVDAAEPASDAPSTPEAQAVAEPAMADIDLPEDGLSIDWSLLDDDSETTAETTTPDTEAVAEGLDAMFDRAQAPLEDDASDVDLAASETQAATATDAAAAPDNELPPSSQWTLVDDTVEPPPSTQEDTDKATQSRVPGDAIAASLADRDFGLELVDPIEYLAPDAPPAHRETELYTAPEMMSMTEALAPQQIDENIHAEAVAEPLPRAVVMAASIGGPDAVREFLSGLPKDFPAVFILTQHMGTEFIDLMVKQLGKLSALPVRVPISGERAHAGEVLVVPHGAVLTLSRKGAIEMTNAADADDEEPTIAATMGMAAKTFGADTLAVIFSGMVADAVAAARAVVDGGGSVWAQDAASCVVSTMVDGVSEAGIVKFSATPALLAQHLIEQFAEESTP